MRLTKAGTLSFQTRVRVGGAGSRHLGRSFGSWDEAECERRRLEEARANGGGQARRLAMRQTPLDKFAVHEYWPKHGRRCLVASTQADYRRVLFRDVVPYWRRVTLQQIWDNDELIDEYLLWLEEQKRKPDGTIARAAVEEALGCLCRLLEYAVEKRILPANPAAAVRAAYSRERLKPTGGRTICPVRRREVQPPQLIEKIRLHVQGSGLRLREKRLLVTLLAFEGLRPGEACALLHSSWRDKSGPRDQLWISRAVQDVDGALQIGPPKNKKPREIELFPAVAEELEALYQAQGCPPLDTLVVPSSTGRPVRWDNYRDRSWYPALYRAGISEAPVASAPGACDPYSLRHSCATLLMYAVKPDGDRYTHREIADHMGHSLSVFEETYAHVMTDIHGFAGRTMEEIIRLARRKVWGPQPGDPDFGDVEYTLHQAAALTGIPAKRLHARIRRGSLPARRGGRRLFVRAWDLVWAGLLSPAGVRAIDLPAVDGRTALTRPG